MARTRDQWLAAIQDRSVRVCVIGLGYVGLPTAVRFAEKGFHVVGADLKASSVDAVNKGKSPLPESLSHEAVAAVVKAGRLRATTDPVEAVRACDAVLVTVGTPVHHDHSPDMGQVDAASRSIRDGLRPGSLVVLESTVFPGATREHLVPIVQESGLKAGKDFLVAYCPERISPGVAGKDAGLVDRVLGGMTPDATVVGQALYQSVTDSKIHPVSSMEVAEAAKAFENTQRDVNIALANELALLCEKVGIDAWEVLDAAASKWNFMRVQPGGGVGGHCIPVDPWYLHDRGVRAGFKGTLIPASRAINDGMPHHAVELLKDALATAGRKLAGSTVVVLGLAYKENLGDSRESPTWELLRELEAEKAVVRVVDPHVVEGPLRPTPDAMAAARGADAVVVMTPHDAFRSLDPAKLKVTMRTPVLVDMRRLFVPAKAEAAGLIYRLVGRGTKLNA